MELSRYPANALQPEHLVMGILRAAPAAIARHVSSDWTLERLEIALNLQAQRDPSVLPEGVDMPISSAAMTVMRQAVTEADETNNQFVEPVHLVLSLLDDDSQAVARVLREAGLNRESILRSLR